MQEAHEAALVLDDRQHIVCGQRWGSELHRGGELRLGVLLVGRGLVEPGEDLAPRRAGADLTQRSAAAIDLPASLCQTPTRSFDLEIPAVVTGQGCDDRLSGALGLLGREELGEPCIKSCDHRLFGHEDVSWVRVRDAGVTGARRASVVAPRLGTGLAVHPTPHDAQNTRPRRTYGREIGRPAAQFIDAPENRLGVVMARVGGSVR